MLDSARPGQSAPEAALWPFMTPGVSLPGLNPLPSHLLQFPVGPNSQDLGHHPVWCGSPLGRTRVGLCPVFLFLFSSLLPPLGQPRRRGGLAGRVSQRFHQCTEMGERPEAEKCEEFFSQEAKALPGFRATHSSAPAEGPEAWGQGA